MGLITLSKRAEMHSEQPDIQKNWEGHPIECTSQDLPAQHRYVVNAALFPSDSESVFQTAGLLLHRIQQHRLVSHPRAELLY